MDVHQIQVALGGVSPEKASPDQGHWKIRPGLFVSRFSNGEVVVVDNVLGECVPVDSLDEMLSEIGVLLGRRSPASVCG